MTSARAPVPPIDLKSRIAALQQQQAANSQVPPTNAASAVLPKANVAAGNNALRDRIASFEKQGAVPKPKGRFGFAPPMQNDPTQVKRGELYGNRIPGLSRPHVPVPPNTKGDKKPRRNRSSSRLEELDRYASPSPPGSPFVTSDNGDSIGDVLSDTDLDSPSNPEEAQQQSLDALVAFTSHDAPEEEAAVTLPDAHADVTTAAEDTDPGAADEMEEPPVVVVDAPSEPVADALVAAPDVVASAVPVPEPVTEPPPEPASEPVPEPVSEPSAEVLVSPPIDPTVAAVIEQLDRATQSGDAGSVIVPANALQKIAALPLDQQQNSVQDLLDQLLLMEDALDVATPIKQRFSLNGSLSSLAVRNYLTQQPELAAKDAKAAETPEKAKIAAPITTQPPSGQFLNAFLTSSPDSPVAEPLSPASDIYSAYLFATPAVSFGRALPAIPEAPDSPAATKQFRRGTFGMESEGSTPPSSAPLSTPSDDGRSSISPGNGTIRVDGTPPRVTSPPLSVIIPGAVVASKPTQSFNGRMVDHPPSPIDAIIVTDRQRKVSPTVTRGVLVPAPQSASDSSSSSPQSAYSANSASAYSGDGTSPSISDPVSRKASRSSKSRSKVHSPVPPSVPYQEPLLTPIEGPRGFHAVVHEKVVEGRSRPVSVVMQHDDLLSPTPVAPSNFGDLATLLADAAMLEKKLNDPRSPPRRPTARSAPQSTPTPPPVRGRDTPDRPRPVQDLPESPDDGDNFGRLSQESSITSRTSQYERRPLPARPSVDRVVERKASRPSLERMPSRPSLDQSSSARQSTDSTSSSRPQLQPMFLSADPNAVRVPFPTRPKSAMSHASTSRSSSASAVPQSKTSPKPGTGYLSNLLSRAKSSGTLRSDPRDSVGSSSEDSVMVSTPPTPPYEMTGLDTGSVRSSRMFKNSLTRASNFADRLLHRKDGSNQAADVDGASEDEDDLQGPNGRALPRPPRPLPLPPRPLPPRGLPPPVPGEQAPNLNNLQPIPSSQPGLQRRGSWNSMASVSITDISAALDNVGMYDLPPDPVGRSIGLPPGPNAYTSPRPAPMPPPNQPLPPPPPNQPLPPPPRGLSQRGIPPQGYGLPANPALRPKTLPPRTKIPPKGQLRSGMI